MPKRVRTVRKTYHLALRRDGSLLEVQMRLYRDLLSPDIWMYMGYRSVKKQELTSKNVRDALRIAVNLFYGTHFTRCRID